MNNRLSIRLPGSGGTPLKVEDLRGFITCTRAAQSVRWHIKSLDRDFEAVSNVTMKDKYQCIMLSSYALLTFIMKQQQTLRLWQPSFHPSVDRTARFYRLLSF